MRVPPAGRLIVAASLLATAVGCGPKDEIRTYEAAKPKPIEDAAPTGPDKSRTLGAIIPTGDNHSWFVKFSGPIDEISKHEKAFDEFVNSVRVEGGAPKWTAPAGWTEAPPKALRIVTFTPPGAAPGSPELYLSQPFGGTLVENVNRWRREVGAKDVDESEVSKATTELTLGGVKARRVDAKGPADPGKAKMPPFMRK